MQAGLLPVLPCCHRFAVLPDVPRSGFDWLPIPLRFLSCPFFTDELDKFTFYFTRYEAHAKALQHAQTLLQTTGERGRA